MLFSRKRKDELPAPGLAGQDEAVKAVIKAVVASAPQDFDHIEYTGRCVARTVRHEALSYPAKGLPKRLTSSDALSRAVTRLRAVMCTPEGGTWFTVRISIKGDGKAQCWFDYDEDPFATNAPDPLAYLEDQQAYPRADRAQPEWLKAKLAQAADRLRQRGPAHYPSWLKRAISQGQKPAWL